MFVYILLIILFPIGASAYIAKWKKPKENTSYMAFSIFITNIVMNLFCFYMYSKSFINLQYPEPLLYVTQLLGCLLCAYLVSYMHLFLQRHGGIHIYKKSSLLLGFLCAFLFSYFMWLLGDSGRQSFELFIYNLQEPVNTTVANFGQQVSGILLYAFVLCICFYIMVRQQVLLHPLHRKERKQFTRKRRIVAICIPLTCILISFSYPVYAFHLEDAYAYLYEEDTFIQDHYIDPNSVTLTWPEKKRNLIYIFMESFEASSFSKELGGLNEHNLLPNLTTMMHQGTYFSNHKQGFGGAVTMPQAAVTIAGMVSALSGVNYKLPVGLDNSDQAGVIPYITTLNDLLYEQGYQEAFSIGSYANAYHIGPFYRAHGQAEVIGYEERMKTGELEKGYKVWWGFEDKKLYEFAQADLNELSKSDTPFLYTMSTNDTHRTDGYTDPACSFDYEYPMMNAIACADQQLSEFLTWLMKQPFYENTTVVIVGDHLGHSEAYTATLLPQEERRIFNLILNANSPYDIHPQQNRQFWAGDMFPTVLSSLGVHIEKEQLGLGVNLFSKKPTLIETYGLAEFSDKLAKNSKFYTENFLISK